MKRLLLCLAIASTLFGGTILPELQAILDQSAPTDLVKIVVNTKLQGDLSLYPSYSREAKISYLKGIAERAQRDILDYLATTDAVKVKTTWLVSRIACEATPDVVRALAAREDVDWVMDDFIVQIDDLKPVKSRGDATDAPTWNITQVRADSAWADGWTGAGIVVGNIDTGVQVSHAAFGGRWRNTDGWFDGVSGQGSPYDDNGHGTHTMGTITGGDGSGPFANDIGVAPGATFIAAKAFNSSGSGQTSWITACFDWMAGTGQPDVCSNSWGSSSRTVTTWFPYVQNLRAVGIVVVASIGNTGPSANTSNPPGSYPNCLSVGSVNSTDNVSSFSSRGPALNQDPWNNPDYWPRTDWNLINPSIMAPGDNVSSAAPGGGYASMSGTSMSCPHVAGAAALLKQKRPSLTHDEIFNILTDNADHVAPGGGTWPNNNYGWGRLNCKRALDAVGSGTMPNIIIARSTVTGDGNSNGRLDPGETGNINNYVRNASPVAATNLRGTLRTSNMYITLTDSTGSFGTVAGGDSANNTADPYTVAVASGCPQGTSVPFSVYFVCDETTFVKNFSLVVGQPPVQPGQIIWGPRTQPRSPAVYSLYGMAYNTRNNRLYLGQFRSRTINVVSSDSFMTDFGTIPNPNNETAITDLKYCAYDNTFWVASNQTKRIYKIDTAGVIKRYFASPANDYPVGLAWDEDTRTLYLTDRRAINANPNYLYIVDTLGNSVQPRRNIPFVSYAGARCLALDRTNSNPFMPTLAMCYTWFNTSGGLDSIGIYEIKRDTWQVLNRFLITAGWNVRGVEFDPRDGNYWISIMQNTSPPPADNSVFKVTGFHQPTAVEEQPWLVATGNVMWCRPSPNPFNNSARFSYLLPRASNARITVYDASGREVRTLVNQHMPAGEHAVTWNGADNGGRRCAPGIYFYDFVTGEGKYTGKALLLK